MLIVDSIERAIPVRERLKQELKTIGMELFETEGISHKKDRFSVFQRFLWSDNKLPDQSLVRQMVEETVDTAKYGIFEWLDFNVFFLVYTELCGQFFVFRLRGGIVESVLECDSCEDLAAWLSSYVESRRYVKPFVQTDYFTCLDRCLRDNGVPTREILTASSSQNRMFHGLCWSFLV